jgi:asparagine N-glycosylation enzyme membrane subunit Stt3
MSLSELTSFYVLTQGEIDKLWEFFLISHLAIIGWLISVDCKQIDRARKVLMVSYLVLFGGLYVFFHDAYMDMILIQNDLKLIMGESNYLVHEQGFIHQLLSVDVNSRLNRVSIFFILAFFSTLYLLFHPTLFREPKNKFT